MRARRRLGHVPLFAASLLAGWLCAIPAHASEACTIVATDTAIVHKTGPDCETRFAPASSFKLALALMGFETGVLTGPETPARPYDPALEAPFAPWRHTTTPRRWLRYSVVWYSQWLTSQTGMARFQSFVDQIDYGNRDLTGDHGRDNGLTHAWLGSSLKISAAEQIAFLRRVQLRQLALAQRSYDLLEQTVQQFDVPGWESKIRGKTGTTWVRGADGFRTKTQIGWFVGWFTWQGETHYFARVVVEPNPPKGHAGNRARETVLTHLPKWSAATR